MSAAILVAAAVTLSHVAASEVLLDCSDAGSSELLAIEEVDQTSIRIAAGTGAALLQLEETGRELLIARSSDSAPVPLGARPPRLGIEVIPVSGDATLAVRPMAQIGRAASMRWHLRCGSAALDRRTLDCASAAREAESTGQEVVPWPAIPQCEALISHAAATWSSRNGRNVESAERYARAVRHWRAAIDLPREAAAAIGLAEQLRRQGDHEGALTSASQAQATALQADSHYFAARASLEVCLSLQALGRMAETRECLEPLPQAFDALGETSEQANAYYNLGSIAEEEGRLADADMASESALALDSRRISPLIAGRLYALRARIAVRRGLFDRSLVALDLAAALLDEAGDRRWQANNELLAAEVMLALGENVEARSLAAAARERFLALQAPTRIAAADLLLARLHVALGDTEVSQVSARAASQAYRDADMPLRALQADLFAARAGDADAFARAQAARKEVATLPAAIEADFDLAAAQLAWIRGDLAEMKVHLEALDGKVLDLTTEIELLKARARLDMARGAAESAIGRLDKGIDRVFEVAGSLSSASLRYAVGRRLGDLRQTWVDAYLATPEAKRPVPARVWHMLARTQTDSLLAPTSNLEMASIAEADALEAAIAASLVAPPVASSEVGDVPLTSRPMLAYLAARGADTTSEGSTWVMPSLDGVRQALKPSELLVAIGLGSRGALRLSVSTDAVLATSLSAPMDLRGMFWHYDAALRSPTTSRSELAAHAAVISEILWAGLEDEPPSQLLVFGDDLGQVGAVASLPWPGRDQPLVDSTVVSVVTAGSSATSLVDLPERVEVFASSAGIEGSLDLPPLFNADLEPDWIRSVMDVDTVVRAKSDFSRATLQQALATPGSWVHVAAHGLTRQGALGQSGLLLPSSQQNGATFISWIELIERQVGASLVVLNACDLAARSPGARDPRAAFAVAIANGGAQHTVAAMWPLSDNAAAIWVPAFYGSLASHRGPGLALRDAQQRLRASRMYRHPYYWASLIHLTHLPR